MAGLEGPDPMVGLWLTLEEKQFVKEPSSGTIVPPPASWPWPGAVGPFHLTTAEPPAKIRVCFSLTRWL